jgi:hypothetical protein
MHDRLPGDGGSVSVTELSRYSDPLTVAALTYKRVVLVACVINFFFSSS